MAIQVAEYQMHICDVCRLNDFDVEKKPCGYCGLCDAWICKEDMNRWDRRFKAWYRRKTEPGYRGVQNYEELAKGGKAVEPRTNS